MAARHLGAVQALLGGSPQHSDCANAWTAFVQQQVPTMPVILVSSMLSQAWMELPSEGALLVGTETLMRSSHVDAEQCWWATVQQTRPWLRARLSPP